MLQALNLFLRTRPRPFLIASAFGAAASTAPSSMGIMVAPPQDHCHALSVLGREGILQGIGEEIIYRLSAIAFRKADSRWPNPPPHFCLGYHDGKVRSFRTEVIDNRPLAAFGSRQSPHGRAAESRLPKADRRRGLPGQKPGYGQTPRADQGSLPGRLTSLRGHLS